MPVPLLVLNGPTASGKSGLAILVAERLAAAGQPAQIVNADSMLVYRGMDIGTAKPTPAERARVHHHLIDIWDLDRVASVADFQVLARSKIAWCRERGIVPILAGGSALYVRAVVDEFEFPGTDAQVRRRWENELERLGPTALHAVLAEREPQAAARIEPGNGRRIVRALEILELTGSVRAQLPAPAYALSQVVQMGLALDRDELDARIARRVGQMWDAGFVAEVRELADDRGLRSAPTASRALGYRQVLQFLDGVIDEEQAAAQTIAATRRFARKQLSWFRRDQRIRWYPALDPELSAAEVVRRILAFEQDWGNA